MIARGIDDQSYIRTVRKSLLVTTGNAISPINLRAHPSTSSVNDIGRFFRRASLIKIAEPSLPRHPEIGAGALLTFGGLWPSGHPDGYTPDYVYNRTIEWRNDTNRRIIENKAG